MRALAIVVAALALAGCPSSGSCPPDTFLSEGQCVGFRDAAVPSDLAHGPRDMSPLGD